jgi:hypothetical protein
VVEDRVRHRANVGAERPDLGRETGDWNTPVADRDEVVTSRRGERVKLVVDEFCAPEPEPERAVA